MDWSLREQGFGVRNSGIDFVNVEIGMTSSRKADEQLKIHWVNQQNSNIQSIIVRYTQGISLKKGRRC